MGPHSKFCFQHHARFLEQYDDIEIISLYDNSAHGTENGGGSEVHTAPTSSGKILKLNTTSWEAELVQGFYPPDDLLSKSQGSTQLLPNKNVLVNWGSEGAITEFLPDGTPIFHAYMDSDALNLGVENYRGFRYNWTGLPNEVPAITALKDEVGTSIYVSWNGDTETKLWRFYEQVDGYGSRAFLGEVERTGFETSLHLKGVHVDVAVAEAIDSDGRILTVSGTAPIEPEVLPPNSAAADSKGVGSEASTWWEHSILKVQRLSYSKDL